MIRPSSEDLVLASFELEECARRKRARAEEIERRPDDPNSPYDDRSDVERHHNEADALDRVAAWLDALRLGEERQRGES